MSIKFLFLNLIMGISAITLYNILRKKLGDQETAELMEFMTTEIKSESGMRTVKFMTKEDKIELIDCINKSKTETIIWIVVIGLLQFMLTILSKKIL